MLYIDVDVLELCPREQTGTEPRTWDGSGVSAGVESVARVRRDLGHLFGEDGVRPKVRQHFHVARERRRARIDDSIPAGRGHPNGPYRGRTATAPKPKGLAHTRRERPCPDFCAS